MSDAQIYAEQNRQASLLLKKGAKADQKYHAIQVSSLSGHGLERFETLAEADGELEDDRKLETVVWESASQH